MSSWSCLPTVLSRRLCNRLGNNLQNHYLNQQMGQTMNEKEVGTWRNTSQLATSEFGIWILSSKFDKQANPMQKFCFLLHGIFSPTKTSTNFINTDSKLSKENGIKPIFHWKIHLFQSGIQSTEWMQKSSSVLNICLCKLSDMSIVWLWKWRRKKKVPKALPYMSKHT